MSSPASASSQTPSPYQSGRPAGTTGDLTKRPDRSSRRWLREESGGRGSGTSLSSMASGHGLANWQTTPRPTMPTGKNQAGSIPAPATTRAFRSTRSTMLWEELLSGTAGKRSEETLPGPGDRRHELPHTYPAAGTFEKT